MRAIIAQNNLGYIGLNGTLPWRCSADLKHFKALTEGGKLLVGYNTSLALPPLKNRTVAVDNRGSIRQDYPEMDWCIGGKKTYEKYAPYFTELHISHINDNTIGDTMVPDWSNLNPNCKIFVYHFETNKPKVEPITLTFDESSDAMEFVHGDTCDLITRRTLDAKFADGVVNEYIVQRKVDGKYFRIQDWRDEMDLEATEVFPKQTMSTIYE